MMFIDDTTNSSGRPGDMVLRSREESTTNNCYMGPGALGITELVVSKVNNRYVLLLVFPDASACTISSTTLSVTGRPVDGVLLIRCADKPVTGGDDCAP